jgi:hypothetical protein
MKQYLLFTAIAIAAIAASCTKAGNNMEDNSFVPVSINYDRSMCPCCGWGYFVYRQDSSILYKCDSIPANSGIMSLPVNVKIKFHIIGTTCQGPKILIDEVKL